MSDDLTAIHEAAHSILAHVCGRPLGPVGVRGECGRSLHKPPMVAKAVLDALDVGLPFTLWPWEVRARFEGDTLVLMSGAVAELLLASPEGRTVDPVHEVAVELAADLPEPTEAEVRLIVAGLDDPAPVTDEEQVARIARTAHGSDLVSAQTWLDHLAAQTRYLVLASAPRIERLAGVLSEAGTLSALSVAALIERPWTST